MSRGTLSLLYICKVPHHPRKWRWSETNYQRSLHKELVKHGAGFLQYLDSKTMATHIIASSVTPKKAVEFAKYRVVNPAWVTDSIKAGKLLHWSNYRLINEGPRQKVLKFGDGGLQSEVNPENRSGYREQIQGSFYTSQFSKSSQAVDSQLSLMETPTKEPLASLDVETPTPVGNSFDGDTAMADAVQSEEGDPPEEEELSVPVEARADAAGPALNHPMGVTAPESHVLGTAEEAGQKPLVPRENMTSEEHNAWLLLDPHIRKASTANPNFLKQFYSESRLHHLSTWKAELKSKMQRLADERGSAAKSTKRTSGARRYIMHVDFDSFFCAVSLKKHPEYVEKPTVVAHGTGNGSEIASCNYPARKFGVKNGMWMKRAQELCPDLKVLPYDFPAYEEASRHFYEAILDVGGVVQSVSVDEALLDVTTIVLNDAGSDGTGVDEGSIRREQERADQIATELRARMKLKTGCAVSVGTGANILLAKVALRKAKPDGQHQVRPEEVLDLLADLEVKSLPGVAYNIGGKLEEMGILYVRDIRAMSKERLTNALGPKTGEKLWEYARGIDKTEVGDQPPRKSVSAEVSWGIRFTSQPEAEEFVMNLCKELERRLLSEQVKGTHLTIKIMRRALDAPLDPTKHLGHGKCDTFNKSATFGVATNGADAIGREAVGILRSFKFSPGDLRGLGVQMTKLVAMKATSGRPDGSQRRLQFAGFTKPNPITGSNTDADECVSMPLAAKGQAPSTKSSPFLASKSRQDPVEDATSPAAKRIPQSGSMAMDPIEEGPVTPKKAKGSMNPAAVMARHYQSDPFAKTPLNVAGSQFKFPPKTPGSATGKTPAAHGTQFVLPPNPDPEIVAQLPRDIRARLMEAGNAGRQQSPSIKSAKYRSQSPAIEETLPPEIDPEVFGALPDDMKAEILAQYGRGGASAPIQPLPQGRPQSRASEIPSPLPRKKSPAKRGINSIFRAGERRRDAAAGLVQTNFLDARPTDQQAATESEPEELDADILAELPEDVRREIIEDYRRRRLATKSGLNMNGAMRRANLEDEDSVEQEQTLLVFPALPRKTAFGSSNLGSQQEIKDMLDAWHTKTKRSGPHRVDVEVFEKYLSRVVVDERNMDKAVSLVKWLEWIVEFDRTEGKGRQAWMKALRSVKDAVQNAAHQRGLKALDI